ncbi:hypothetical protein [Agitococcus lubricus]|uniref:Uncharacterized protein n=1 Tax=Agitococcus lubricus TaxID=1077255 RepID=A0A2T5IUX1_9GAMM|nr:hypothetical protein [Agitococcus lubricus]PTQ87694.1 hypothetical protein C8N29_11718 [Agitococcus lubricus]
MKNSSISSNIPVIELPIELSSKNLELRLLPYWQGVKHYRAQALEQYICPQDYYWNIVASSHYPTVANGKVVGLHSRADIYFSRLPVEVKNKIWRNFGLTQLQIKRPS